MVYIETENFSCVDNERYDTGRDQNGYEQRRNWVKTRPAIKLNQ